MVELKGKAIVQIPTRHLLTTELCGTVTFTGGLWVVQWLVKHEKS